MLMLVGWFLGSRVVVEARTVSPAAWPHADGNLDVRGGVVPVGVGGKRWSGSLSGQEVTMISIVDRISALVSPPSFVAAGTVAASVLLILALG